MLFSGLATQYPPARRKNVLEPDRLLVKPRNVQLQQAFQGVGPKGPVVFQVEKGGLPAYEMEGQPRRPVRVAGLLQCRIELLHEVQVDARPGSMDTQVKAGRPNHVQIGIVSFGSHHTAGPDVLSAELPQPPEQRLGRTGLVRRIRVMDGGPDLVRKDQEPLPLLLREVLERDPAIGMPQYGRPQTFNGGGDCPVVAANRVLQPAGRHGALARHPLMENDEKDLRLLVRARKRRAQVHRFVKTPPQELRIRRGNVAS